LAIICGWFYLCLLVLLYAGILQLQASVSDMVSLAIKSLSITGSSLFLLIRPFLAIKDCSWMLDQETRTWFHTEGSSFLYIITTDCISFGKRFSDGRNRYCITTGVFWLKKISISYRDKTQKAITYFVNKTIHTKTARNTANFCRNVVQIWDLVISAYFAWKFLDLNLENLGSVYILDYKGQKYAFRPFRFALVHLSSL
jgi:hypothetical protein